MGMINLKFVQCEQICAWGTNYGISHWLEERFKAGLLPHKCQQAVRAVLTAMIHLTATGEIGRVVALKAATGFSRRLLRGPS